MEELEIKALGEKVKESLQTEIKANNELVVDLKEAHESMTAEVTALKAAGEKVGDLEKSLEAISKLVKNLNPGMNAQEVKSVMGLVKNHIEGDADLKNSIAEGRDVKFQVKTVGTISIADNLSDTSAIKPTATTYGIDPNIVLEWTKKPKALDFFEKENIPEGTWTYTEQKAKDGEAAWKAEGASADQIDYEWATSSSAVKEIKVFTKVTKKALQYIPGFLSAIQNLVTRDLRVKTSYDVLYSTESATAPKGLTKHDIGFPATTSLDGKFKEPSIATVATVCKSIIMSRDADDVNFIMMNPLSEAELLEERDSKPAGQANIVMIGAIPTIAGVPVIFSNQIEAGYILIGDASKFNVHPSGVLDIELGTEDKDLRNGIKTLYVSQFYHVFLKQNYVGGFIYDNIEDIKTQITQIVG